jgi:hypothetical protein
MTVKFETAPTESENGPVSLGSVDDLPGKLNCLRSLKIGVLPSTPFYQSYYSKPQSQVRRGLRTCELDIAPIYAQV